MVFGCFGAKINVSNGHICTLKHLIPMTSKRRMGSSVCVPGGILVIQLIVLSIFCKINGQSKLLTKIVCVSNGYFDYHRKKILKKTLIYYKSILKKLTKNIFV